MSSISRSGLMSETDAGDDDEHPYTPDDLGERQITEHGSGHPGALVPTAALRRLDVELGDRIRFDELGDDVVIRQIDPDGGPE